MEEKTLYYRDLIITVLCYLVIFFFVRENNVLHIGAFHLLLSLVSPAFLKWNHLFWHYLTIGMQKITNPVLFGAIFFIILTPISFFYRLFKKKKQAQSSTFVTVNESVDKEFFNVPW